MSFELLIAAPGGDLEEVQRLVEIEKIDINFVGQLEFLSFPSPNLSREKKSDEISNLDAGERQKPSTNIK